jgi:SMI1 / KNR4 family (SUKH-1)
MSSHYNIEKFIDYFERSESESTPKLSIEEILDFEKSTNLKIPEVLKKLYLSINGTTDYPDWNWQDVTSDGYCIYSLRKENLLRSCYLIFGEWVYAENQYAIDIGNGVYRETVLHLIDHKSGYLIATSFSEFVELFLSKSDLLINADGCPIIKFD